MLSVLYTSSRAFSFGARVALFRGASTPQHTRSFLTTPRIAFPTTEKKKTTKSATKSTKSKPKAKSTTAAKKRVSTIKKKPTKAVAVAKPKKVIVEKPKPIRLTKELLPPKRAPTSYLLFYMEFLRNQPNKPAGLDQIRSLAMKSGQMWKGLFEWERQTYVEKATVLQQEYRSKHEEWVKNVEPEVLKAVNKKRSAEGKSRISTGPKRPASSYVLFGSEYRAAHNGEPGFKTFVEASKSTSDAWNALPEAEKDVYKKRSETMRAEFKVANATEKSQKATSPALLKHA